MHLIKVKAAGTLLLCFALFAAGCGKDKNGVIPSQGNGINESDMADKPVDGKTIKDRENSDISTDVFISQLAGSWYPDDKSLLDKMLSDFLQQVPERKNEKFQALILPHAGYRYSGQTAAYGVKNLDTKQIKRVVIIGPSHHAVLKNRISVLSADYVSTPLGKVEVDTEAVKALLKSPFVISSRKIHEREHSVQMEIPLFQKTLDNFKIISVVAGDLDSDSLEKIALLLKQLGGPSTLFAASSDFIHFGKRFGYTPFVSDAEAGVKKINFEAADFIKKMDAAGFLNYVQKTGATICGRIPIALLLKILPKKTSGTVLHY
jgi:AmmeMemoRadiSam system protein B